MSSKPAPPKTKGLVPTLPPAIISSRPIASDLNSDIDTTINNTVIKTVSDKAIKAEVQEINNTDMRLRNISASQRNKKKHVSQVIIRNLEQKERMNKIEEEMNVEHEMGSDEEPH